MVFIPSFYKLVGNTYDLDKLLSSFYNRYNIMGESSTNKNQTSLERWIKRTEDVVNCNTERTSQRDVFKILIDELKCLPKGEDEKKGTMILIGALLHRYFRLIISYEDQPYSLFFTNSIKNLFSCTLFRSIREALQLNSSASYYTYKKLDNKSLDVMTIVSCLEIFRDYMLIKDENEKPRWKKYSHFKDEPQFEHNLKELIVNQSYADRKNKHPILDQFKAIQFIQSLAMQLHADTVKIGEALEHWGKALMKAHPDFSLLDVDTIKNHLSQHIKSENLRIKIMDLFSTDYIQSKFEESDYQTPCSSEDEDGGDIVKNMEENIALPSTLSHNTLVDAMKNTQLAVASCTLFGGYALLLQMDTIPDHLKNMMLKALGEEKKSLKNTNEDFLEGVSTLKDYLESNPDIILDWSYFSDKKGLEHQISRAEFEDSSVKKTQLFANSI